MNLKESKLLFNRNRDSKEAKLAYEKACFEAYESVGFESKDLKPIADEINVLPEVILNHARSYGMSSDGLGLSQEEYKLRTYGSIDRVTRYDKRCFEAYKEVGWDSKKLVGFSNEIGFTVQTILKYSKRYAMMKLNMTEAEYYKMIDNSFEKKTEYYKACYEAFDRVGWCSKKLGPFAQSVGVTIEVVMTHARSYALNWLHLTEEEYALKLKQGMIIVRKADSEFYVLLKELMNISLEDPKRIIEVVEKAELDINVLKNSIAHFAIGFYPECIDEVMISLREKVDVYNEYAKRKRALERINSLRIARNQKDNELLLKISELINEFDVSNFKKIKRFCEAKGIAVERFKRLIDFCKKTDVDLYTHYCIIVENKEKQLILDVTNISKRMADMIKNGVLDNGIVREFDLIDYYSMTNYNYFDFLEGIRGGNSLTREENALVRHFLDLNKCSMKESKIEVGKILKGEYQYGDINGIYETSLDERKILLGYLEENNIPLNRRNYSLLLKRYINGFYPFNKDKNSKLVRVLKKEEA